MSGRHDGHRGRTSVLGSAGVAALLVVNACTSPTGDGGPDGATIAPCPTPSAAKITSSDALTGQDLLRRSDYFDLMIAHGSLENLQQVLASAEAPHNAGAASPADVQRLRDAIDVRGGADCPEVPPYSAYDFGDVAFDGVAVDLEG